MRQDRFSNRRPSSMAYPHFEKTVGSYVRRMQRIRKQQWQGVLLFHIPKRLSTFLVSMLCSFSGLITTTEVANRGGMVVVEVMVLATC